MRHFIYGKANGEQGSRSFSFRIGFVLLYNGHDDVTLVSRGPRYTYVELGVHGRRFRISRSPASIVPTAPPPPGQYGPPRLFRVQRRLGHPIVWADVDDVELCEMPGEVFERHPVIEQRECLMSCIS